MQKKKQILITVSAIIVVAIVTLIAIYRPIVTIQRKGVTSPAIFFALNSKNSIQSVSKILEKDPDAVNAVQSNMPAYFKTPLRIAVGDFNEPLTAYLIRKGAKIQEALDYFRGEKETKELIFLEKIIKENKKLYKNIKVNEVPAKKLTCRIINGKKIEQHVILSNADISNAIPYQVNGELYNIRLKLTHKGQSIVEKTTNDNIGKCFGFWINGKLVASPEINTMISTGVIFIPVYVDLQEAEQMANGIMSTLKKTKNWEPLNKSTQIYNKNIKFLDTWSKEYSKIKIPRQYEPLLEKLVNYFDPPIKSYDEKRVGILQSANLERAYTRLFIIEQALGNNDIANLYFQQAKYWHLINISYSDTLTAKEINERVNEFTKERARDTILKFDPNFMKKIDSMSKNK